MTTATDINTAAAKRRQAAAESRQVSHANQRHVYLLEFVEEKTQQMADIDRKREALEDDLSIVKAKLKESDKENEAYQALKEQMKALKEQMEAARDQELLEEKAALDAQRKAHNDRAKAIYEDLETEGLPRKAFQHTYTQRNRSEPERIKYEAGRLLCVAAMGLETGEQLDYVKVLEEEMAAAAEADIH